MTATGLLNSTPERLVDIQVCEGHAPAIRLRRARTDDSTSPNGARDASVRTPSSSVQSISSCPARGDITPPWICSPFAASTTVSFDRQRRAPITVFVPSRQPFTELRCGYSVSRPEAEDAGAVLLAREHSAPAQPAAPSLPFRSQSDALQPPRAARRGGWWIVGIGFVVAFLTGSMFGGGFSGPPKPSDAAGFHALEWREYDFPKAGLKASFPRRPVVQSESAGNDGVAALLISCDWPATDLEFYLHCFEKELPFAGTSTQIRSLGQQVLADYPAGKLTSSRCFTFGGMPALEFQLETPDGPALRRMIFARGWTYVLSVAGADLVRHEQSIKHFLNSLQIEEAADGRAGHSPEVAGKPRKGPDVPDANPGKRSLSPKRAIHPA
jgi:hypothetical protein